MRWPARTIWDTHLQSLCVTLSTRGELGPEVYLSPSFAQVSFSPARVAINPNRIYPIEAAIRRTGRFAINLMPAHEKARMIRLMRIRRREPRKAELLGLKIREDEHGIPYLEEALRTTLCEVESVHDTGDHTLFIGRT